VKLTAIEMIERIEVFLFAQIIEQCDSFTITKNKLKYIAHFVDFISRTLIYQKLSILVSSVEKKAKRLLRVKTEN
jgi:hypothetical protein